MVIGGHFDSSFMAATSASERGSNCASCILLAILAGVALLANIAKSFDGCSVHNKITLAISRFLSFEILYKVGCSIKVLWNWANGE